MKNIIDRIVEGGAKIAGYLAKTVSTRLAVAALAALAAGGAWATAPVPIVVWESDLNIATKTGTDGNSYTIELNDNTVTDGNIVIASGASKGAIVNTSAANASSMTVLIKYTSAPSPSASVVPASIYCYRTGGSIPDVGMVTYRANDYNNYACWYVQSGSREFNSTDGTDPVMSASGGYLMMSYDCATLRVYAGNTIAALAGGAKAYAWGSSKMNYVGLGGPTGKTTGLQWNAWGGMVIEKVAIFPGNAYSNTDLAEYMWPSETKAELSRWLDDGRSVLAWRASASGTGNFHESALSAVNSDGSMSAPVAMNASGGVGYTSFIYGNSNYTKPGWVLYYDASGYKQSSDSSFSELSLGGMCVTAEASDGNPYTITGSGDRGVNLGHPDYTTYFRFDKSFTFNRTLDRTEQTEFKGIVNVTVAEDAVFDVNSAQKEAAKPHNCALASGATLVMAGEGQMKLGILNATGGTLDFSKLSTSRETPFIDGTVQLAADTAIKLPAGATSPYAIGTAVMGTCPASITIGTRTYVAEVTAVENAGEIAWTICEADIDAAGTYGLEGSGADDLFASISSTGAYVINVNESATLNVASATSLGTITFNVASGKTLTLTGAAIAASSIYLPGEGVVKVSSAGALVGTAKGPGVLQYNGVLPTITSGISFSNAVWTGTMWLKDFGSVASSKVQGNLTSGMANWGNSGSKVKFTNVKAYAPDSNVTAAWTLVLEDGSGTDEYAWRCDNGYSNNTVTFGGLSGTGTFYDQGTVTSKFTFNSFDGFTGKFDIASTGHQIAMPASATLTVAQNSSIRFGSQGMLGTLNIPANVTLTSTGSDAVSYNIGSSTVNVYGTLDFGTTRWTLGPNTVVNLYEDAIVQGTGDSGNSNAAMDFNVSGGSTIHAIGNATVSCTIRNNAANGTAKINVDEGKTLTFSGNLVGSYGFKKQGVGVLKLTGTIEKYPAIEEGTVLLGGNKTWDMGTLRDLTGYTLEEGSSIAITQTKAEYGSGVTTMTGVDSSITSIIVNKADADGTPATITPSDGAATLSETAVVSGSAVCNHDYEFDNAWTDAGSDQKDAKTWDSADPNFLQDGETSNWSVYTAVCPGNENTFNLSGDWSAAIRCTVPQKANGVIVAFGNNTSFVALAAGATENTARLVKGGGDAAVTELATMSVAHATTAMHVYAFVKTANAVDIYCDGARVTRYNGAIGNLSDGFQFGTVRSVNGNVLPAAWGIVRLNNSEKDTGGNVDYMRIYNFAIDANMIAKLSADHPYVPSSTAFTRTLAGESGLEWSATGAWTKGGETAAAPDADGIVELTASADSTIAANLSAAALYETLTFKGAGAITVTKATGGATLSAVEVAVDTDTTVAADAVDFTVSRVAVAAGKTLTFDVSGIASANGNWANAASVERIRLTGLATLGASATVAVTPTTAGYWNLSAEEDGGYWYLSVAPNRATGSIYWQSGTYWNSTYNLTGSDPDNPAVFTTDAEGQTPTKYFAGDTVIIPTTTKRYFGPISDGAAIRFDCNGAIEVTKTDSLGYVFKNATVTVASGTTLNFVNSWNGASPEVYGGAISGAGKVQVASGITLTLSNGATIAAATALTGAGTVNFATVPTAQMTFDNWTGTVKLPQFAAAAAKLTFAGNSASTVALAGITSGWLGETDTTAHRSDVAPTLRLDGNVTITGMSTSWQYSFAKITGTGNLSFTSANAPASLTITEIADYTGTLNNSTTTALTVGRISLASAPAADTRLLATNGTGTVTVNAVYVNGSDSGMQVVYKEGGVYSPPATYVAEYGGVQYETVQEAINAAVQAGQTYASVTILDPTAECPDEYYVDNGTLKKKPAAVCTAGTLTYYTTIELAMQAANQAAYMAAMGLGTDYDYVIFFENAAVTQMLDGMKIKQVAGVTVTVATSSAEFTSTPGAADAEGIVTYALANAPTAYTWTDAYFAPDPQTGESVEDHRWSSAGNWSFGSGTTATRYPQSGDTVSFSSASTVTLDANAACASMTIAGCAVSISADSAKTLTAGTISLTAAESSISVTDVTLSPVPTTTVANAYVKTTTAGSTTTYAVAANPNPTVTITADEPVFQDYTNATIVATVTADGTFDAEHATYTATVGNQSYDGKYENGRVTFEIPGLAGASANVTITATPQDSDAAVATTDTSFVFGTATDWFEETAAAAKFGKSGTWTHADTTADKIVFSGDANATFTPTKKMTGNTADVVWVVSFDAPNDDDLSEELVGAQTAFRLATASGDAGYVFQLWASNAWNNVAATGITPAINVEYTITNHFDYGTMKFTSSVNGQPLAAVTGGATTFDLPSGKTKVDSFEFAGAGALTGIAGNFINTMLYEDDQGNAYATLAAALASERPLTALSSDVILTVEPGMKLTAPGMTAAKIKPTYNGASIADYVGVSVAQDGAVTLSATDAAAPSATAMTAGGIAVGNVKPGLYYWVEASTTQNFADKTVTVGQPKQATSEAAVTVTPPNPTGKVIFYRVAVDAEKPAPATP